MMAPPVSLAGFAALQVNDSDVVRHSAVVRVTHWVTAFSFAGLVVSGIAILLAHPRLYWGETGAVGTPALIDLPLPFVLTGQTGWGRYLHFLTAWVSVLTGALYVVAGLSTGHFRNDVWPDRTDLSWTAVRGVVANHLRLRSQTSEDFRRYNVVQRMTYLAVVFVLFPAVVWTGLAMSPALTSVFPILVNVIGGEQSARTIHFFCALALLVFFFVHVALVSISGFSGRMRAMITGQGGRETV